MIKVLLVDDEDTLLEAVSMYLKVKENIDSETCLSPAEAMNLIERNNYDLIISDYDMPKTNGIEFLNNLRKGGNEIPFILFTGKSREEIAITALNSGVDYYIQKGGDIRTLFTEMSHVIRKTVREAGEKEKVRHLTRIVSTIRNIREIIENEEDFNTISRSICSLITTDGGYENARIILFARPGDIVAAEQSGFGDKFDPILEWLRKGELTGCAKKALESDEVIISERCLPECTGCPFRDYHSSSGAMTKRLMKDGSILGIVSVTVPSGLVMDKDEIFLFDTLARDLAESVNSSGVMKVPVG